MFESVARVPRREQTGPPAAAARAGVAGAPRRIRAGTALLDTGADGRSVVVAAGDAWTDGARIDGERTDGAASALARLTEIRGQLSTLGALATVGAGWPAAERQAMWSALDRLSGTLTAAKAAWLVADREAGTATALGDGSVAAAVDRRSGCGMRAAHEQVRQADALSAMPQVAAAVGGGRLPVPHLDVVARVLERSAGAVQGALTSAEGQATVVRLAESTDVRRFSRDLGAWVAALDPAQLERDHQAQRAARFLHLSDSADGTYLKGRLDRVSGEVVRRALDRMGETPDDARTSEQARADALTAMASTLLDLSVSGSVASVRPHVNLVVDAETFAAVRSELGRRALPRPSGAEDVPRPGGDSPGHGLTSGPLSTPMLVHLPVPVPVPVGQVATVLPGGSHASDATDDATGDPGRAGSGARSGRPPARRIAPAVTEDGVPVPFSELTRILCDAEVSRVVLSADSTPVDLGRSVRLFSGSVRRAVVVRDQVCAFGGCGKPARWGEVHHIAWWDRDGGATSVDNGVLLCVYHHHEVHRADLRIYRQPPHPGGVLPGVRPRPRYEFRTPDGRLVTASLPRAAADVRLEPSSGGRGLPSGAPRTSARRLQQFDDGSPPF